MQTIEPQKGSKTDNRRCHSEATAVTRALHSLESLERLDSHMSLPFAKEGGKRRKEKRRKGARQLRNPIIAAGAGPLTNSGHLVNNNNNNKPTRARLAQDGPSTLSTALLEQRQERQPAHSSQEVEDMTKTTHSMCKVNNQTAKQAPSFASGPFSRAVSQCLLCLFSVFSQARLLGCPGGIALVGPLWPSLPVLQSP